MFHQKQSDLEGVPFSNKPEKKFDGCDQNFLII